MNILLDTSTVTLASRSNDWLGREARALVLASGVQRYVSACSWYEVGWKVGIGKLDPVFWTNLDDMVATLGAGALHLSKEHAATAALLPPAHRDPFDKLIAAQAICEDLAVLSPDLQFETLGARRVW